MICFFLKKKFTDNGEGEERILVLLRRIGKGQVRPLRWGRNKLKAERGFEFSGYYIIYSVELN